MQGGLKARKAPGKVHGAVMESRWWPAPLPSPKDAIAIIKSQFKAEARFFLLNHYAIFKIKSSGDK